MAVVPGRKFTRVWIPEPLLHASIAEVMDAAGVEEEYSTEVQDIVDELAKLGVIEVT